MTGRTRAEVRDKLKALHREMDNHVRSRPRYMVGDALDDWLADGLAGVSARTVRLYEGTIAKALRAHLGSVRLTELTAGDVEVRAIRHAQRHDLVGRNVAALVKPPRGRRDGRQSKSLT